MAQSDAAGAAATQIAQANRVPQVPEAGRIRPLPKPNAMSRPGSRQTQDNEGYAVRARSRMEVGRVSVGGIGFKGGNATDQAAGK